MIGTMQEDERVDHHDSNSDDINNANISNNNDNNFSNTQQTTNNVNNSNNNNNTPNNDNDNNNNNTNDQDLINCNNNNNNEHIVSNADDNTSADTDNHHMEQHNINNSYYYYNKAQNVDITHNNNNNNNNNNKIFQQYPPNLCNVSIITKHSPQEHYIKQAKISTKQEDSRLEHHVSYCVIVSNMSPPLAEPNAVPHNTVNNAHITLNNVQTIHDISVTATSFLPSLTITSDAKIICLHNCVHSHPTILNECIVSLSAHVNINSVVPKSSISSHQALSHPSTHMGKAISAFTSKANRSGIG